MAWGKLDDGLDDHPKVVALLDEDDIATAASAIGLWTLCLTWAHRNTRKRGQTPGLLPAGLPRRFIGPIGKDAAQLLVKHGLWEARDDGGWLIHDFADYLPTDDLRAARAEAGRRGAAARWGKEPPTEPDDPDPEPSDSKLPSDSHDAASNIEATDGTRAGLRARPHSHTHTQQQPTVAAVPPLAAGAPAMSVTQRSKRITDAYAEAQPMCRWAAINGIVIKAIKANRWADDEIRAGLLRLAAEGRTVTVESLRVELDGQPPGRASPSNALALPGQQRPSTTDQRVNAALALAAKYETQEVA